MGSRPIETKCRDGVDADSLSVLTFLHDDLAGGVCGESIERRSYPLGAHLRDSHQATHRADSRRVRLLLVPILDQFLQSYENIDAREIFRSRELSQEGEEVMIANEVNSDLEVRPRNLPQQRRKRPKGRQDS